MICPQCHKTVIEDWEIMCNKCFDEDEEEIDFTDEELYEED